MSLVSDVLTYSRYLLQTDNSGLSDTNGLVFLNDALQDETREMINRGVNAAQTQESYTSITTNNPNTYLWPSNLYMLKAIEVDFTGSGGQNYMQAFPVDVSNIQFISFDRLRANQSTQNPLYNNRGDTFEIFPTPISAVGTIRIFYFTTPTEYASTASTINYPQSLDYRALSAKVASLYALSLEKPDLAAVYNAEYMKRLEKMITILVPASQAPVQPMSLQVTGWGL